MTQRNDAVVGKKTLILFESDSQSLLHQLEEIRKAIGHLLDQHIEGLNNDSISLVAEQYPFMILSQASHPAVQFGDQQGDKVLFDLNSFFRGCVILANANPLQALDNLLSSHVIPSARRKDDAESVNYLSTIIDNSAKWSAAQSYNIIPNVLSYWSSDYSYDPRPSSTEEDKPVDIEVIRTNWYGRGQRRIFRFYSDHFERIEPSGSVQNKQVVKASFLYSNIDKISIENRTELIISFLHTDEAQYISSRDCDIIAAIITARLPINNTITIVRNLAAVKSVVLKLPETVTDMKEIRWSKHSQILSIYDGQQWHAVDLEVVSPFIMGASGYIGWDGSESSTSSSDKAVIQFCTVEVQTNPVDLTVINNNFTCNNKQQIVEYPVDQATGIRCEQSGIIAEVIHSSDKAYLFTCAIPQFYNNWRVQNMGVAMQDIAWGSPVISSDGRYVAISLPNASPRGCGAILIHRVQAKLFIVEDSSEQRTNNVLFNSKRTMARDTL
ncbi:hypothetical protein PROFUN_14534 [Planoprotostelium fungivorum]|uniref:Uncharacterized protein n=1 Tax=Planoprotostelium fungivorum TaxID=1890364 RepID=A0A2P6N6N1_9EUKA|nr:hypothetical protein PROFUN_14534 [Planoprotostelium fungivorum]